MIHSYTVRRWPGGAEGEDELAIEEPLELRVEGEPLAITMRTPGHDLELAAGFLCTEGIIEGADDLLALAHLPGDPHGNTVVARLSAGVEAHQEALLQARRATYASSSCGICGKASLDRLRVSCPPVSRRVEPAPAVLHRLPAQLRAAQEAFHRTGGLHAAALVSAQGELEVLREDVGRHNAVDKVLGWRLLQDRVPVDDRMLVVSSRAGFEIVQKARVAGVGTVVALGAATSLAVDLARDGHMVLIGFLSHSRYTRYA